MQRFLKNWKWWTVCSLVPWWVCSLKYPLLCWSVFFPGGLQLLPFICGLPLCSLQSFSLRWWGVRCSLPFVWVWLFMACEWLWLSCCEARGAPLPHQYTLKLDTLVSVSAMTELLFNAPLLTKQGKRVPVSAAMCLLPLAGQPLFLSSVCPV